MILRHSKDSLDLKRRKEEGRRRDVGEGKEENKIVREKERQGKERKTQREGGRKNVKFKCSIS